MTPAERMDYLMTGPGSATLRSIECRAWRCLDAKGNAFMRVSIRPDVLAAYGLPAGDYNPETGIRTLVYVTLDNGQRVRVIEGPVDQKETMVEVAEVWPLDPVEQETGV